MRKKLRMPLILILVLGLGVALSPAARAATLPSATQGPEDVLYQGDAYGTYAFVGNTILAGKSAKVGLGCATGPGVHKENEVLGVNVPPVVTSGTVHTTADTYLNNNGVKKSKTTAATEDVALLDAEGIAPPLITASLVKAVSATRFDGSSFDTSADGSTFVGLSVLGVPIPNPVAPNTEILLPGVGRVVLNEQIESIKARSASLVVNMIHVYVTDPGIPGIAVGSEIIVSHAKSGLRTGLAGFLSAMAYGTRASLAGVITSGPSALVNLGCLGGNKSNNVAKVNVPPLFTVGEVVTTASGSVSANSATVQATSTVQMADLLDGLVTAEAVMAVANGSSDGTTKSFDSNGSSFVKLVVDGKPLADVDPNTVINLVGVGTLYLYRVIETPRSIEVRMIELDVTEPGIPGIPAGTNIRIAVAKVGIK